MVLLPILWGGSAIGILIADEARRNTPAMKPAMKSVCALDQ
jgi:hypothetical protein